MPPIAIHSYADAKGLERDNRLLFREAIRLFLEGDSVPASVVQLAKYTFQLHEHPAVSRVLVDRLVASTDEKAIDSLQAVDTDPAIVPLPLLQPYAPSTTTVAAHADDPMLDFEAGGPYSVYNEELFFHIPLTIAIQLAKNERYAEARHWLHYIFDPTDQSLEPSPTRYWKYVGFKGLTDVRMIEEILSGVAADSSLQDQIKSSPEVAVLTRFVSRSRRSGGPRESC